MSKLKAKEIFETWSIETMAGTMYQLDYESSVGFQDFGTVGFRGKYLVISYKCEILIGYIVYS